VASEVGSMIWKLEWWFSFCRVSGLKAGIVVRGERHNNGWESGDAH
jgi:hypothetical protein